MLTVLYGASCVGKTTMINRLVKEHAWIPVSCYMTREVRPTDIGRIEVTNDEFLKLEQKGHFQCVNYHFETSYGTPKNELIKAANDPSNKYILDFMLRNSFQLDTFQHKKIIMVPESLDDFKQQIKLGNRVNRLEETLDDLQNNYNTEMLNMYRMKGFLIIKNSFKNIDRTLNKFLEV